MAEVIILTSSSTLQSISQKGHEFLEIIYIKTAGKKCDGIKFSLDIQLHSRKVTGRSQILGCMKTKITFFSLNKIQRERRMSGRHLTWHSKNQFAHFLRTTFVIDNKPSIRRRDPLLECFSHFSSVSTITFPKCRFHSTTSIPWYKNPKSLSRGYHEVLKNHSRWRWKAKQTDTWSLKLASTKLTV